jgi:16S rRNA processing protein RimM
MSSTSSTSEPRALPATILVGRILRPHGLRGEVIVEVLSDVAGRFSPGSELALRRADGGVATLRVESSRQHGKTARVLFGGCERREDAEALRGGELEVELASVPEAPQGAFWQHELLGAHCHDRRTGDLGRIEELLEQGGGLLLRVVGVRGELLVPFAAPFVGGLDRAARRLEVDLPEGLIEACASRS